jgi:hypothetical protein
MDSIPKRKEKSYAGSQVDRRRKPYGITAKTDN